MDSGSNKRSNLLFSAERLYGGGDGDGRKNLFRRLRSNSRLGIHDGGAHRSSRHNCRQLTLHTEKLKGQN